MNKFIVIGIGLVVSLGLADAARAADGDIKLANGAVVPSPANGFQWTARKPKPGATQKIETFVAAKQGSLSKMMLLANPVVQDTDEKRMEIITKAVVANANSIKSQGLTEVKITKPEIATPIADRVSFSMSGLARSGKTHYYFLSTIVFTKKATYQFQAISQSEAEAQALIKVADSMKE